MNTQQQISRRYKRSKKGLSAVIFSNQRANSKHRKHQKPEYTLKELRAWLSNTNFDKLHDEWVASDYERDMTPSCDRLDDYKHYTLDNLQVVTLGYNVDKAHADRRNGINNKVNVAVEQLDTDNTIINTFYSMTEASRCTEAHQSNIFKCCNGIRKTAGGYAWKYKLV